MDSSTISATDSYAVKTRRERLAKLAGTQRLFKTLRVTGPALSPEVFERLQTAQAAVMDLEAAIADEGIEAMTGEPVDDLDGHLSRIEWAHRYLNSIQDGNTDLYDARHALWVAADRVQHEIRDLNAMPEDRR